MTEREKLANMVVDYNDHAAKKGYPEIFIDYKNKEIIGEFVPKDDETYSGFYGFFKNWKISWENVIMRGKYEKIERALYRI